METRLRLERRTHDNGGGLTYWSDGTVNHPRYEDCRCYRKRGLFRKSRPLDTGLHLFRVFADQEDRKRIKGLRQAPIELDPEDTGPCVVWT